MLVYVARKCLSLFFLPNFITIRVVEQVLLPASMGVDGLILWGSSNDYHGQGCALIGHEMSSLAGPIIERCIRNRQACAETHCNSHGRCVDFDSQNIESACSSEGLGTSAAVTCRCDPGFTGSKCELGIDT